MKESKRGLVVFTIILSLFLVCCANVSASKQMHLYRFWDTTPGANQHFYTSDKSEKAVANQNPLYIYEGIQGYVYSTNENGRIPLYRLHNNTNGNHIYTTDETEKNNLVSTGWTYEKTEGYVYSPTEPQPPGTVPLYHFYHTAQSDNFYTTSEAEKKSIEERPYPPWNQCQSKGIECYLGGYIPYSDTSQIILSLYSPTNSHVGLWDSKVLQTTIPASCEGASADCPTKTTPAECQAVATCTTPPCCTWYDARDIYKHPAYDIYYDEIFGYPYGGAGDPHACTGSNKVLELYQDINSHAQKNDGTLLYLKYACYGDLDCQITKDSESLTCPDGYKTIARLYQEENSHVSEASNTAYPIKICCRTEYIPTTSEIYWADMSGNLITQADIGDTVLMIYENHAGQSFSFNIREEDNEILDPWDDDIDAVSTSFDYGPHLAAKWTITQDMYEKKGGNEDPKEEFYFVVKSGGAEIGKSGELNVSKKSTVDTDSPPNAIITAPAFALPQDQRRFRVNQNIDFKEDSWDADDSLKLTWEFGDGSTMSCNWPEQDCDVSRPYTQWGTKEVYLKVEEIGRSKKASNYTEVYIYDAGTNVFAVMQEPENLKVFPYTALPIRFNASQSYVSKCQIGSCLADKPAYVPCYPVSDLFCYNLPKFDPTGNSLIGANPGQYNLWFDWNFSSGDVKYGNWSSNYPDVVDFTKYFFNPQKYRAYLKVGYEEI